MDLTMTTPHTDILLSALDARNQEFLHYQINIDNYTLAIAKINADYSDDEDLAAFRADLESRLEEEKRQQLRCKVIRDVIAAQLAELEATS